MTLTFLDFFAGIGGFRLGLERAGMTCVGAAEIADFQRAVYAHRFGHAPTFGDVTKIKPEDVPAADLWCGGFPCQDVSTAGKREGAIDGERTGLIWKFIELAGECQPTWILLENVPGLLQRSEESGVDYRCVCGWPLGRRGVHLHQPEDQQGSCVLQVGGRDPDDEACVSDPSRDAGDVRRVVRTNESGHEAVGGSQLLVDRRACSPGMPAASSASRAPQGGAAGTGAQDGSGAGRESRDGRAGASLLDGGPAASVRVDAGRDEGTEPPWPETGSDGAESADCPACGRDVGIATERHVLRSWVGAILGALAEVGYVGSWRVLDAQFFGVAQRRERVFFLARRAGAAGPRPSEVLLEPPGVRRDPPPRRATGQEVAGTVTSGATAGSFTPDAAASGRLIVREYAADVAPTLVASGRGRVCDGKTEDEGGGLVTYAQEPFSVYPEHGQGADLVASPVDVSPAVTATDGRSERGVRVAVIPFDRAQVTHPENRSRCEEGAPSPTIAASGQVHVAYSVFSEGSTATQDHARETDVARTLDRNGGFAAGQGGTVIVGAGPDTAHPVTTKSRNTPDGPDTYVVLPLDVRNSTRDAGGGVGSAGLGVGQPGDPAFTVTRSVQGVFACGVRRLMPVECERLFGFPDGWTDVPWVPAHLPAGATPREAHDGKRYEALGNSVAVVVIEWIGRRLMRALGGHNANSVR